MRKLYPPRRDYKYLSPDRINLPGWKPLTDIATRAGVREARLETDILERRLFALQATAKTAPQLSSEHHNQWFVPPHEARRVIAHYEKHGGDPPGHKPPSSRNPKSGSPSRKPGSGGSYQYVEPDALYRRMVEAGPLPQHQPGLVVYEHFFAYVKNGTRNSGADLEARCVK